MKRKAVKAQIRRIKKLGDKWLTPMGLKWWSIEHRFNASRKPFRHEGDRETVMKTTTAWQYRRAWIDFNVPLIATLSDHEVEHDYVHELCHILVEEMRGNPSDEQMHCERAVDSLADAFMWTREWDKGAR